MHRSAVVVRSLPRVTSHDDVKRFFDTRLSGADAFVFPLVQDTQNLEGNYQCTTVTLKESWKKRALNLNNLDFVPAAGGRASKIQIDASFIGSITLAEHMNPQFDIYFVHGVGGDAFSSWVSESSGHMWPRDSFPEQCLNLGVRGRFSTIGYDAKILDQGAQKTIRSAAESILTYIRADRPQGCKRPIFFVCHSLGGIVVSQALVLAFKIPAIKQEYEFLQGMVYGVAFFGTPFQGSANADFMGPIASLVGSFGKMQTSFLDDMKTSSKELPNLTMYFNNVKTKENIAVRVFVEKRRDGPSKVTTRTSAILPFEIEIAPIEIDADHRGLVKFKSANEARLAITEIVYMIRQKLGFNITPVLHQTRSKQDLTVLAVKGMDLTVNVNRDKNAGFAQLSQFDTVFIIDDTGSMQEPADSSEPHTSRTKSRWDVLTKSLQYIANIAAEHDRDGVDIHFLISTELDETNIHNGQEVLNLLGKVNLEQGVGGTFLEPALAEVLGPYITTYRNFFKAKVARLKTVRPNPINIIVLTDGKADDSEDLTALLVHIAGELDEMNAPRSQIGIQFLQVGDDEEAAKFLKYLDDELKAQYGIRDFVDTKTFRDLDATQDFTGHLRSILLGAVNRNLDDQTQ